LDRQREHVANAALGLNHARCTGIGLQLALQPQDLDIDAAIENILVNSGGLQQVFPRQRALRRFEKGQQQRILAFARRDRRRIGIEQSSATPFELPALESISASFRITRSCNPFHFLPPQYGTEAGEQFAKAEWFYNIVVRPEFEADDAIDFVETMAGRDDNRNIRVGTNFPTDKFGRSTARQSGNGTVDQRSSAIDAGPAGIPPRCGRRQFDLDTSLDDEWIVIIGHARRRIRAAEIPPRCLSEEIGRRSAHDRAEIMDQERLTSKAAGKCARANREAASGLSRTVMTPSGPRGLIAKVPLWVWVNTSP